jgi:hypothetical protein
MLASIQAWSIPRRGTVHGPYAHQFANRVSFVYIVYFSQPASVRQCLRVTEQCSTLWAIRAQL